MTNAATEAAAWDAVVAEETATGAAAPTTRWRGGRVRHQPSHAPCYGTGEFQPSGFLFLVLYSFGWWLSLPQVVFCSDLREDPVDYRISAATRYVLPACCQPQSCTRGDHVLSRHHRRQEGQHGVAVMHRREGNDFTTPSSILYT